MSTLWPSRRRFIGITASGAGLALLPLSFRAAAGIGTVEPVAWRGVALGADALLQIHHPDRALAARLVERSIAEVRRLERVFSLYRADSAISALNRDGVLNDPPTDLVGLLGESERFSRLTGGAFDASVQPLWQLYADHFGRPGADPDGPSAAERAAAVARVGHERIAVDESVVRLGPGMAITLDGIAQGYITDRVADLLLNSGIEHALVDMGETRALGDRPSGEPWRVGIQDPASADRIAETVNLRSQAIATSGGYGTVFDAAGRFNHLFDPRSGLTSSRYASVSVIAPLAVTADALSTAFSLLPLDRTQPVVSALGISAHFIMPDGSRLSQTA